MRQKTTVITPAADGVVEWLGEPCIVEILFFFQLGIKREQFMIDTEKNNKDSLPKSETTPSN